MESSFLAGERRQKPKTVTGKLTVVVVLVSVSIPHPAESESADGTTSLADSRHGQARATASSAMGLSSVESSAEFCDKHVRAAWRMTAAGASTHSKAIWWSDDDDDDDDDEGAAERKSFGVMELNSVVMRSEISANLSGKSARKWNGSAKCAPVTKSSRKHKKYAINKVENTEKSE
jgi:hypothetical protein